MIFFLSFGCCVVCWQALQAKRVTSVRLFLDAITVIVTKASNAPATKDGVAFSARNVRNGIIILIFIIFAIPPAFVKSRHSFHSSSYERQTTAVVAIKSDVMLSICHCVISAICKSGCHPIRGYCDTPDECRYSFT